MSSILVSALGSCNSVKTLLNGKKNKLFHFEKRHVYHGKFSTADVPPGTIADRLDNCSKSILNSAPNNKKIRELIQLQIDYVTKQATVFNTMKLIKRDKVSAVLVDVAKELLPTVHVGPERFEFIAHWNTIQQYFPTWFTSLEHTHNIGVDRYDLQQTEERNNSLKNWIQQMNTLSIPIVAITNSFTDRAFYNNIIIEVLDPFCRVAPFLKVGKSKEFILADKDYMLKQIRKFYQAWQKLTPQWNWVDIEPYAYADLYNNYFPGHLHQSSYDIISEIVEKELLAAVALNQVSQKSDTNEKFPEILF